MRKILVALVVLGVSVCGCGKKDQDKVSVKKSGREIEITSPDAKTRINTSDRKVEITGPDGSKFVGGKSVKVPADFPSDVHVYNAATVVASSRKGSNFMLVLVSKDDPQKILETYASKMKASGWTEQSATSMGPLTMRHYAKGKRQAGLSVVTDNEKGQTTVSLTVSEKK